MTVPTSTHAGGRRGLGRVLPLALIGLFMLALPAAVSAHEITNVEVDCPGETITITGVKFGENIPTEVTVTGPEGYSATIEVTTADWTAEIELGPNGEYSIDWPDSGDFGPVAFSVDCPPPPAAEETPTPPGQGEGGAGTAPTLPPTSLSEEKPAAPATLTWLLVLGGLAVLTTGVAMLLPERRRR